MQPSALVLPEVRSKLVATGVSQQSIARRSAFQVIVYGLNQGMFWGRTSDSPLRVILTW